MATRRRPARAKRADSPPRGLVLPLRLAQLALLWERLWPAFWPVAGLCGLFIALALLDVANLLPAWLHSLALAAFAVSALGLIWRGIGLSRLPSRREALRRLEVDSGLRHRPLSALGDRLATDPGDRDAAELWRAHQRRLAAQLKHLRLALPRAGLAAVDPLALRSIVGLLLVLGLATGWADWPDRLQRALMPSFAAAATVPASLDVWVNPPAYTGLAPLFLDPADGRLLTIPDGSTLLAQVRGGEGVPALLTGNVRHDFSPITADTFELSSTITAAGLAGPENDELQIGEPHNDEPENDERVSGEEDSGAETAEERRGDGYLRIEQGGRDLAAWPLALIPDLAPEIVFLAPPSRSQRASLRIDYEAKDDYGLASVSARITRIDKPETPPIELKIILPASGLRQNDGSSFHDLTAHPWAGIAVEVTLVARDALGQDGVSEPFRTVLPERVFNHPVARALVELRRQLTVEPDQRQPVIDALDALSQRPEHFFHDTAVALSIFAAARRLLHDRSDEAVPSVQQLLWDTALKIEEGELAIAERDLRDIQQELMEALARGADNEEIQRLLDSLQQALDNFLDALAEQMQDRLAQGYEPQEALTDNRILQSQDLQDMIDKARELARSGAKDAVRDLMAQLQEMLENLRAEPFAQGQNKELQDAHKMMRDLERMMNEQQELLDRSFERSQQRGQGEEQKGQQSQENRADAQSQESLRRDLGDLMRQLGEAIGEIPKALGRAEGEMRSARDALEGGNPKGAIRPQTRSLDQLQQGMQTMADRFMQMFNARPDRGSGNVGARSGQGSDPLGRNTGEGTREALEGVEIPEASELQRSRAILDELRRRRGERQRPAGELQYIDRLLRQF